MPRTLDDELARTRHFRDEQVRDLVDVRDVLVTNHHQKRDAQVAQMAGGAHLLDVATRRPLAHRLGRHEAHEFPHLGIDLLEGSFGPVGPRPLKPLHESGAISGHPSRPRTRSFSASFGSWKLQPLIPVPAQGRLHPGRPPSTLHESTEEAR